MKQRYFLSLILIASCLSCDAKEPPGSVIIDDESIFFPVKYINSFLSHSAPDSARFYIRRSLPDGEKRKELDATSLLYRISVKWDTITSRASIQEYQSLIKGLIDLNYGDYFRLYYKLANKTVYSFKDFSPAGIIKKEMTQVDPATRMLELKTFFPNGNLLSRTQLVDTNTLKQTKSVWYGNYYSGIIKQGVKSTFFYNGAVRSLYNYKNGKKSDTAFVYDRYGEVLYQEVWKNDLLVAKLTKKNKGAPLTANNNIIPPDKRRKAFLVGIDKYPGSFPGFNTVVDSLAYRFNSLQGCNNDINLISEALTKQRRFLSANISKIADENATRTLLLSAFNKFIDSLERGDIVFFHFSGLSGLFVPKKNMDKDLENGEFAFVCSDVNLARYKKGHNGYISKSELDSLFSRINKRIGANGQLILSWDAGSTGSMLNDSKKDTVRTVKKENAFRGENNSLLFNFIRQDNASVALFSGTTGIEMGYETRDENNKPYGLYSYCLAQLLFDPGITNSGELFSELNNLMEEKESKQHPDYFANFDLDLFEVLEADDTQQSLPVVNKSGNAWVISTGISQYKSSSTTKLKFSNCVNDAIAYTDFFSNQFNELPGKQILKSYLLTDTTATKDGILKAINETISNSNPEDYFIFNFSGYCRPLSDSTGKKVTYFVPYGLKNIADTNEIKQKGISLTQLKDLLQLIPANNQLFITEAGSTNDFQKEFIQALIESSPSIATLSNKNRIFLVPKSSGLDKFYCNNMPVEHGPLNYYITNLSSGLNFFGLFENAVYAEAVKYAIQKKEVDCDYFKSGYFDIFFEKDYIKDLKFFLPEEVMKSRGVIGTNQAKEVLSAGNSKRYALVMGTSLYDGKPDWEDLNNGALDAKDIGKELAVGFGYDVKLLIDKPIDSFYSYISYLSQVLKSNDQLIIYVSGHGDFDSVLLDDGFIVCKNSKPVKEDPYRNTYIQHSKLEKMVNRLPANQVLMVLDVCFGGTFDERVAKNKGRTRFTDYDDISDKAFFAKKLEIKTRLYLTSGGKRTVPDGYKGKNSPFAIKLLGALRGRGGSSKMLTARDLHKFVEKLPSGPLVGSFGDDGLDSEFILLGN